jgi:signal transduction histidine kinase
MIWQRLYRRLLAPRSRNEDARRRELILNILLLGMIALSTVMFMSTLAGRIFQSNYAGLSPWIMLIIVGLFAVLLWLSRRGLHHPVAYVFLGLFFLLATWPTAQWGILLPQGILMHSLVIVMTGVLLNSRAAFYLVLLMFCLLLYITYLHDIGSVVYNTNWMKKTGGYPDVIIYGVTFAVIALVSWLSNREIERSLKRAKASEHELLKERRLLETKVKERTQALEKAQVEKMMDLQRFAEFGRLSSTLLHELANPLMAVSLDLEQLEGRNRSKLLGRAREGISHMEQYVDAARRQLRSQSEVKPFDIATEINRVAGFLEPKAAAQHVSVHLQLVEQVQINGDSTRFNHIISNLLSNAIDAYDGIPDGKQKIVSIVMQHQGGFVEITVTDFGEGIAKDQIPHLFEPFYTTKQAARGTGLGLAIVKQAVEEAFEGKVSVAWSKQEGTRFVIRLPIT